MKEKKEKGIVGIDIVSGMIIFVLASSIIFGIYYNIYITATTIKIHEVAIGIITEIFEKIDLEYYDNITDVKVSEIINESKANEYFNEEKNHSNITYQIQKYSDNVSEAEDLVKKITIVVNYQINGSEKNVSMSKIKIRE